MKKELSFSYDSHSQCSLKDEILELQKQLEEQIMVRFALEKALSDKNMSHDVVDERIISKPHKDLIKEINVLEMEVRNLEKNLLTMYRKMYGKRLSSLSMVGEEQAKNPSTKGRVSSEFGRTDDMRSRNLDSVVGNSLYLPTQDSSIYQTNEEDDVLGDGLISSLVHRSQSSLSHRSDHAFKSSPPLRQLEEAINSYQSLPLAMLERNQKTCSNLSLAEHLRNKAHHSFQESPNEVSEEMIKCISAIYCHISDPPLQHHGFNSSPISISSSVSLSPRTDEHDSWDLQSRENRSGFHNCDIHPQDEGRWSCYTLAEVHGIRRDNQSLHNVQHMLKQFRYLVLSLKEVQIRNLKHGQKLAFWINIHNALVMHALLVYGIPQSNIKRISMILKAAYNIGGYAISVDMIQSSILQCRLPRPGQWFQALLYPRTKLKAEEYLKAYAINHPEPRLYFALCSGSSSDPPVRRYTSQSVFEELEVAKEEYIQTNIKLHKENKIMVPKIVDCFAKDLKLCPSGLAELLEHFVPHYQRLKPRQSKRSKVWKKITYSSHNFDFLFKLPDELVPS